jgi:hypothetical protein
MKETGEEFRQGKIALPQSAETSAINQENGVPQEPSPLSAASAGHQ